MTSQDIYSLGRRLYALIPSSLQRWTGEPTENMRIGFYDGIGSLLLKLKKLGREFLRKNRIHLDLEGLYPIIGLADPSLQKPITYHRRRMRSAYGKP